MVFFPGSPLSAFTLSVTSMEGTGWVSSRWPASDPTKARPVDGKLHPLLFGNRVTILMVPPEFISTREASSFNPREIEA